MGSKVGRFNRSETKDSDGFLEGWRTVPLKTRVTQEWRLNKKISRFNNDDIYFIYGGGSKSIGINKEIHKVNDNDYYDSCKSSD